MLKTNSQGIALVDRDRYRQRPFAHLCCRRSLLCSGSALTNLTYGVRRLLIAALIYLLYRFNERRLEEIRQAEAERRQHAEDMATIHMNTIESLAIAIDAKDQTTHGHVRRTQLYATRWESSLKSRKPN